jgi:methylenetetrahydrofolate reductase (NADPH)
MSSDVVVREAEGPRGLAAALGRTQFELVPLPTAFDHAQAGLPRGSAVTITVSPTRGIDPTLDLAERLSSAGYVAVPHLAARTIRDRSHLAEVLARLDEAAIRRVLVIAGDGKHPGEFVDALSLLRAMADLDHPFEEVSISAYPEGHPLIDDQALMRALLDKQAFATSMTTQLCFEPKAIGAWARRARASGVRLPMVVGIPGPVDRSKLLSMASRIGVATASRYLRKNRSMLAAFLRRNAFNPDRLLKGLAPTMDEVSGFHVYTFNQVEQSAAWHERAKAHARIR